MWSLCWWLAVPAGARRAGRRLFPVGADVPAGGQGGQGLGEGAGQRDLPVQAGEREARQLMERLGILPGALVSGAYIDLLS